MSAQVFRGRTVADAHRAAVASLGPEAVLVSTRQVARPGVSGLFGGADFEVAATPAPTTSEASSPRRGATVPFALAAYGVEPPPTPTPGPDLGALRAELKGDIRALKTILNRSTESSVLATEIGQLRELIEGLAEPRRAGGKATGQLRALGIEGPAAAAIARALPARIATPTQLRDALRKTMNVAPWPLAQARTLIGLVGPSGVGKTTTAAKLGAHARAEGKSVAFVACDAYRVGAIEQLSGYARLMGAEVLVARTAEELRSIIDSSRADVVIVDTSGRPPMANGAEVALAPQPGTTSTRARHILLCTTATVRPHDAGRIGRRFAVLSPTSMAITKIDETAEPAGIIHAPWATKLPVSILCFGQRVPEDIAPATVDGMLEHLVPGAREKAVAA